MSVSPDRAKNEINFYNKLKFDFFSFNERIDNFYTLFVDDSMNFVSIESINAEIFW